MRNKLLVALAILGVVAGLMSAYISGSRKKPLAPAFHPAQNPYAHGIFATGIVESYQPNGSNINIFPEVPGTVTRIMVSEGAQVAKGDAAGAAGRLGAKGHGAAAKGPGRGRPGHAAGAQGPAAAGKPAGVQGPGGLRRRQPPDGPGQPGESAAILRPEPQIGEQGSAGPGPEYLQGRQGEPGGGPAAV